MRSLCCCSALLTSLALFAGCGGGGDDGSQVSKPSPLAPRLARLFEYDRDAPLDLRVQDTLRTKHVTVESVTYAAPGGRVPAFLIVPHGDGKRAGVIFMHGFGGSRSDFLEEGVGLSLLGANVVTITSPFAVSPGGSHRELMIRNVIDLRRAIDLLLARDDVDPNRIALVGYSLGAEAAAITAGVEDRLRAVIVQASPAHAEGASELDPVRYVPHAAPARLFFQGATYDQGVPPRDVQALIAAASQPAEFKWYPTTHSFEPLAFRDQIAWLRDTLPLRAQAASK
jgi:dienelactone hydrolase